MPFYSTRHLVDAGAFNDVRFGSGRSGAGTGRGGVFEVRVDGHLVWSKKEQGRFPDAKELKQLIRDHIAPDKDLGHSDR